MAERKNILVTIPATVAHRQQLESAVAGGMYDCSFEYTLPGGMDSVKVGPGESIAHALMAGIDGQAVSGKHVIVGSVPAVVLRSADSLEWLQLSWAGADAYCAPGVLPEHVQLTNASGAYGLSCSEHLLAQTFALLRHIPEYVRNQEKHLWRQNEHIRSVEGSTVLVMGLGDIGGSYARKVKALGAYVIGLRRSAGAVPEYCDEVATLDQLDAVLPRADIVANSLPGGEQTAGLLNEERLRSMKSHALFVNVGRGDVLDQEAAKRVLADGHLGGLALDVFVEEPLPENDELWENDRVLVTPHVAGQFFLESTLDRVVDIAAENLQAWSRGEDLTHVVNRSLGY